MQKVCGCQICGGEVALAHGSVHGLIFMCRGCGFRFLDAPLETTYGRDYYRSWFEAPGQDVERIKRVNFQRLINTEVGCLKGKKLLDVGCATGFLLKEAQKLGAEISGVDVNEWAVTQARERLPGARIYLGTLADAIREGFFAPESFDVIVGADVIEHLIDVKALFRDMLRIMLPGGCGVFTLPDVESMSSRLMGAHWFQYKLEHVTFLTRKALGLLSDELDFTVESITPHKKKLTPEFICNVLQYHNSGVLNLLGCWVGKLARRLRVSKVIFSIGTGEMLVRIKKLNP